MSNGNIPYRPVRIKWRIVSAPSSGYNARTNHGQIKMEKFPPHDQLKDLIHMARHEDLGPDADDVTSRLLVPAQAVSVGTLYQKKWASPAACRLSR